MKALVPAPRDCLAHTFVSFLYTDLNKDEVQLKRIIVGALHVLSTYSCILSFAAQQRRKANASCRNYLTFLLHLTSATHCHVCTDCVHRSHAKQMQPHRNLVSCTRGAGRAGLYKCTWNYDYVTQT